jgi:hypothetical protein
LAKEEEPEMTTYDRSRTDPIAGHAYILPVVREVPIRAGAQSDSAGPHALGQPVLYAADAHAW